MKAEMNFRDLSLRLLVIAVTVTILIFVTRENVFDLHFKIRNPQPTHPSLLLVELPEKTSTEEAIRSIQAMAPKHIFISHYMHEQQSPQVTPFAINENDSESLTLMLKADRDGIIRRAHFNKPAPKNLDLTFPQTQKIINFRGPPGSFPIVSFEDLSDGSIPISDRVIVIKPQKNPTQLISPVGLLTESEIFATLVDNILGQRFIRPKNFYATFFILILLLALTTSFLIYLPTTLALISSIAIAITYISLSLWIFDTYFYWTPILASIVQMFFTFILISNYKFVLNEKTRWSLEKESLYTLQLEEMKTNFLSLFSHDLKTPLAKIIGISDTLTSKVSDPEIKAELEKINHASTDLEKYIKRILKMSQMQSKNISLNRSSNDVNILIEKAIDQNRFAAQEKKIRIEKKLAPLFMVDIDGALVQEVILNFIENAIKYSPENSRILVNSEEVNNYIKVSVKDEGQGIPKEAQENIWEKYYRFDDDKSGYGLGLFLSRYVIHLHKGQVFLNSKEKMGSEFGFLLPMDEDQQHESH